jgi:uncharacterized protein (TIGR02145 family)
MWVFIVIGIIIIILIAGVKKHYKEIQINNIQDGGLRKKYPIFTERLEQILEMSYISDNGNRFTYEKTYKEKGTLTLGLKLNAGRKAIVFSSFSTINGEEYVGIDVLYCNDDKYVDQCIMSSINNFIDKGFLNPIGNVNGKINEQNEKQLDIEKFLKETIENERVDKFDIREPLQMLFDVSVKQKQDAERKEHIESIAKYSKRIEQDSKDKDAYLSRGSLKEILKDYSGAILDYKTAIEIDPQDSEGYERIETLSINEKVDQGIFEHLEFDRSLIYVKHEPSSNIIDIDGNEYKTIKIGQQVWMAENLKVTRFQNGDLIPIIEDENKWKDNNKPAFCYYNNNKSFNTNFGALYNWYAVNDIRNIAPIGWHVATSFDWMILINSLRGNDVAGGKLKESGSVFWVDNNEYATNDIGFRALPGGIRFETGEFSSMFESAEFWSTTKANNSEARSRSIHSIGKSIESYSNDFRCGLSVRCVKDLDGSPIPIKTRSLKEFTKEIGIDIHKIGFYRNKNNTLYIAVNGIPNKFIAHVSKLITCKDDIKNPAISTFIDKNGNLQHVLHNLNI